MYLQNNGSPPHYTNRVWEFLNEISPNRWLGRGGSIAWPPRSPDETKLDYYIWGKRQTFVYETQVDSLAALRRRIFVAAEQIKTILTTLLVLLDH